MKYLEDSADPGAVLTQLGLRPPKPSDDEEVWFSVIGEWRLMASVAIMKALSEQFRATPPRPAVIQDWRSRYLAVYDRLVDNLDARPDYKVGRRKVIDETFSEFIKLAADHWQS